MAVGLRSNLAFPRSDRTRAGSAFLDRWITGPWWAWQERRRARACGREVVRLDRLVRTAHPALNREQRYRHVVAAYLMCDAADAAKALRCAEASFAAWPVRRDLTLRDVAHYLAVSELLAARGDAGVGAHLKPVLDAVVPTGL